MQVRLQSISHEFCIIISIFRIKDLMDETNQLLRNLPKVDECIANLLRDTEIDAPLRIIKTVVQETIERAREAILRSKDVGDIRSMADWLAIFKLNIAGKMEFKFKRVINGTGVVIHTNLGRSLLSQATTERLAQAGGYYSNLEFDLETGKRGSRYSMVEDLLCYLTGAEAALVVNNNAAAVLIALETLTKDKEAIVSRGQMVEIGGSFRIPDVMAKSGARLVEVGATNRTHLHDYEGAISEDTALLLRVHTSNFRIIGFTSEVSAEELVALARKNGLFTMEDLGSGSLIDFSRYGFPKEPTVQEIVSAGVDVVTFSGDKLLGGPQAGIIVGKKELIDRIKKNPLNRALRIDKFTLAALESVLREYLDADKALQNIPTLAMLTFPEKLLKTRAQRIARRLNKHLGQGCRVSVEPTVSRVGGGALPEYNIGSWAIVIQPRDMHLNFFERKLRHLPVPIIGRIENDNFLLDVRTIQEREVGELVTLLSEIFTTGANRG